MKDITLREKLIKHLLPVYKQQLLSSVAELTVQGIVDFSLPVIESEIANARKEMKEEMKKKAIEIVNTHSRLWVNHAKVQTDFALIKASIQSLN